MSTLHASSAVKQQTFPRSSRLLKHADFQTVYKQGRKHFSNNMVAFYFQSGRSRPSGGSHCRKSSGRCCGAEPDPAAYARRTGPSFERLGKAGRSGPASAEERPDHGLCKVGCRGRTSARRSAPREGKMKEIATWLLLGYKRLISPLLPASCRFVPTCSEYAAEAVARHGLLRGSVMAAWRLLRCNPFSRGGYDPVPGGESVSQIHKCSH